MFDLEPSSFFSYLLLSALIIILLSFNKKKKKLEHKLNKNHEDYLNLNDKYRDACLSIKNLKIEKNKSDEIYAEKINDLYRFAEFGKLSAGVFHDIVNPLTAIGLNLENLQQGRGKFNKYFLKDAIHCTKKMQAFILSVKKQINNKEIEKYFNINEEIEDCICLLRYKAKKNNVRLIFKQSKKVYILGLNIKFNQVMLNLISNSIDSYKNIKRDNNRLIIIKTTKDKTKLKVSIQDFGEGIKKEEQSKIFKAFYSTKGNKDDSHHENQNNGLGLHSCVYIIDKYFCGQLIVDSRYGKGTKMILNLTTNNKNSC